MAKKNKKASKQTNANKPHPGGRHDKTRSVHQTTHPPPPPPLTQSDTPMGSCSGGSQCSRVSLLSSKGSSSSISSREALNRLRLMEKRLDEEVRVRRSCESAIKTLLREKRLREAAVRSREARTRELEGVLRSLEGLLAQPQAASLLRPPKLREAYAQKRMLHEAVPLPRSSLDCLTMSTPDPNPHHSVRTSYCTDYGGRLYFNSLKTSPTRQRFTHTGVNAQASQPNGGGSLKGRVPAAASDVGRPPPARSRPPVPPRPASASCGRSQRSSLPPRPSSAVPVASAGVL